MNKPVFEAFNNAGLIGVIGVSETSSQTTTSSRIRALMQARKQKLLALRGAVQMEDTWENLRRLDTPSETDP